MTLAYTRMPLDRASALRTDPQWVAATLAQPAARVVPMWRNRCLVAGVPGSPVVLRGAEAGAAVAAAEQTVFLGLDGESGVFAADLSTLDEPAAFRLAGAVAAADVRRLVAMLSPAEAASLAYARGILHWHRSQRFCGTCGAATESGHGGHVRVCRSTDCGKELFPRIEPAVITLVEAPGDPARCLLARHAGAAADAYALLAGFVEIGESLEEAVRREVAEEAGVVLDTVTYQASQAWPFPAGLMVGFRARAASAHIAVDSDELAEARWFTRGELAERAASARGLGPVDSIGGLLLRTWLDEGEGY
jgi:NAD+ diphosphatase